MFHVESYLAPCSQHGYSVLFNIVITLLGDERAGSICFSCICMFILHAFHFLSFSLPLGVRGRLWIVIAALPEFFI